MTMTREELGAALAHEELDYAELAAQLDASDLPLLREFATSDDAMRATKAVYLAGLIEAGAGADIVEAAARSGNELVRIAAASTLGNLPDARRNRIALELIDDPSDAIKKLTLVAVEQPTPELRAKFRALAGASPHERIRDLAEERLRP